MYTDARVSFFNTNCMMQKEEVRCESVPKQIWLARSRASVGSFKTKLPLKDNKGLSVSSPFDKPNCFDFAEVIIALKGNLSLGKTQMLDAVCLLVIVPIKAHLTQ